MAGTILVAVKTSEDLGKMGPYITRVAEAGNRVVFLVPYRPDNFGWFNARLAVINDGDFRALASQALAEWCSREEQKNLAEKAIAPLRKTLEEYGASVAVHLCERSVRKTIKNYSASGDVEMVLMSGGMRTMIASFLDRAKAVCGRPAMPAVHVFAAERI